MPRTVLIQSAFKVNRSAQTKKARSMASGLCAKRIVDYGSRCGDDVNVLNEQVTCGTLPTLVVE